MYGLYLVRCGLRLIQGLQPRATPEISFMLADCTARISNVNASLERCYQLAICAAQKQSGGLLLCIGGVPIVIQGLLS